MSEPEVREERSARERLEAHRELLGKVSDGEIATRAGVSRGVVGAWRRELKVAAYDGYLWTAGRRSRAERRDAGEAVPDPSGGRKRARAEAPRGSRLDAHRELVGRLSDGEVARRVGMTREAVRIYRKKHGIAAYAGAVSAPEAPRAPARAARAGDWGWKVRASTGEERLVLAADAAGALAAAVVLGEIVAVERLLPVA